MDGREGGREEVWVGRESGGGLWLEDPREHHASSVSCPCRSPELKRQTTGSIIASGWYITTVSEAHCPLGTAAPCDTWCPTVRVEGAWLQQGKVWSVFSHQKPQGLPK